MSEVKVKPKDRAHYVSNKDLYEAYCNWHKDILDAKAMELEEPQMSNYIAESIMKICHRLSFRPNFINYSYRDEMVADAIENCIKTVKNFNPAKSTNPFSFITTIAYNAFLRRIEMEKKQSYVKGKLIEELPMDELMNIDEHDEDTMKIHTQFVDYLRDNNYLVTESPLDRKKRKKQVKLHEETLEEFMSDLGDE
jgi:DNA-directed RNA polymerase specialized sigma24 family protein